MLLVVLVAIGALVFVREGDGGGNGESPEDDVAQVRGAVETIRIAIQAGDWETVYRSFSDKFREQCAESDFITGSTERAAAFQAVKLELNDVVVAGDTATAKITFSGAPGEWPFVREDGKWHLLSAEGIEGCGFATPTPTPPPTSTP